MNKWLRTANNMVINTDHLTMLSIEEDRGRYVLIGWRLDGQTGVLAECKDKNEADAVLNRVSDLLAVREV